MSWIHLLEKLPQEWFGIMSILAQPAVSYPYTKLEKEWNKVGREGHRPSWMDFLDILTRLEPLSEGGHLKFQPLFFHLPVVLQKHVVQFLHQHQEEISSTFLESFLDVLLMKNDSLLNGWIWFYLNLLHNQLVCRRKAGIWVFKHQEETNPAFPTSLSAEFQFSGSSRAKFLSVCGNLEECHSYISCEGNTCLFSWRRVMGENTRQLIQTEMTSNICQFDDVIMEEEEEKGEGKGKSWKENFEVMESLPEETLAVTEVTDSEEKVTASNVQETSDNAFEQTLLMKLRESWLSCTAVDPECLNIVIDLPPQQLGKLLEKLDLSSFSDASVLLACQTFMASAAKQISHQSIVFFTASFLLPQILRLEQFGSRVFAGAVVAFVKTFPSQSMESLFRPLLSSPACGVAQCELVMKVIREAFHTQHNLELLCMLLDSEVKMWSDQMLPVVQSLIDTKMDISSDWLKRLTTFLDHNSSANSSNLKFGKLLLSFVVAYGKALTAVDIQQCNQMATGHKTFLHKSIKTALAKL